MDGQNQFPDEGTGKKRQQENFTADEAHQRQRRPVTRRMLEELQQVSDQIMQRRNGKLFEDSTELIRQMREERTRELMGEE